MLRPEKLLAKVRFDEETGLYRGEVLHLCEIEEIEADSIEELRLLIAESISKGDSKSAMAYDPEVNHFGDKLILDLDPYLRLQIFNQAELAGLSVEEWIAAALQEAVNNSFSLEPA